MPVGFLFTEQLALDQLSQGVTFYCGPILHFKRISFACTNIDKVVYHIIYLFVPTFTPFFVAFSEINGCSISCSQSESSGSVNSLLFIDLFAKMVVYVW